MKGGEAIGVVSAWASANQLVLGHMNVEEGSNEITAIPQLLRLLDLNGCLVTIDAIGTPTEIAAQIVEQGGDYVLAVKENQGHLYEDLKHLFQLERRYDFQQSPFTYAKQVNKNHGRLETRQGWATSDPEYLAYLRDGEKWTGLKTVAMIITERRLGDKIEVKTRYFISSLATPAKTILKAKRSHWSIENQLYWVLDIAFRDDASRIRKDHVPENFAILHHMTVNLLKQEKTAKGGIYAKRLLAAWDHDYLLKVLAG